MTHANDPTKSVMPYGAEVSTTALDAAAPSGDKLDYIKATDQLTVVGVDITLKVLHMLTMRGRETKKTSKGSRINYTGDLAGTKVMIFISYPSEANSIKEDELTPGRFRILAAEMLSTTLAGRPKWIVSPMMAVIGFDKIAESRKGVTDFFAGILDTVDASISAAKVTVESAHFEELQILQGQSPTQTAVRLFELDGTQDNRKIMTTNAGVAMWGLGLERCPPCMSFVFGAMEFGASMALMTDIRNQIIASATTGTAAERDKKTSSFYIAYIRRSAQSGVNVCPPLLIKVFTFVSGLMLPAMQLKSDMPEELKSLANEIIKKKVEAISSMAPLLL